MGARWYDPQIGRWISADTIVPDPANPQSLNRYAYVYNNPLKYVDPSGHQEEEVEPLPPSYVRITVCIISPDGELTACDHAAVIIGSNVLLTDDHVIPNSDWTVASITIWDPETGEELHKFVNPGEDFEFVGPSGLDQEVSLFVFRESIFPPATIAPLGDADDLEKGTTASQAFFTTARNQGVPEGLYPVEITGRHRANTNGRYYKGLFTGPYVAADGDSGSPLYVDGRVYGVLNGSEEGRGCVFGQVTRPLLVRAKIALVTAMLVYRDATNQ